LRGNPKGQSELFIWDFDDETSGDHRPLDGAPHPDATRDAAPAGESKHCAHGKRWQRYEKPQPGHRLQVDVTFLERITGTRRRFYQFTAIDDCTRMRVLKVFDAYNQRTAIQFIDDVRRCLPFRVHVVQTDNGAEFQCRKRCARSAAATSPIA